MIRLLQQLATGRAQVRKSTQTTNHQQGQSVASACDAGEDQPGQAQQPQQGCAQRAAVTHSLSETLTSSWLLVH